MTENLNLWNIVRRVPEEHLKGFTRGGGFKGTAIKPMWSIMTMTERFGPIGEGWGTDKPEFQIIDAGNEKLVFCTLGVWIKGQQRIYGVGGDKAIAQFSSGPKSDDEAFKKAFTDALTNALKHLGVGADIHMGLWDGNKYVDEAQDDRPASAVAPPIHNNSKANSRDEYMALIKEVRATASLSSLNAWKLKPENIARMENLNSDFADLFRNEFSEHVKQLKGALAA